MHPPRELPATLTDDAFDLATALDAGATISQLRSRQDIQHVTHGIYVRRAGELELDQRCRLLTRVLPPDHAFSHWTAATLLGLPSRPSARVHVIVDPRPVNPYRRDLVVHRAHLPTADRLDLAGLSVTTGERLFVDLSARLPIDQLVAFGDGLLRSGLSTMASLTERVSRANGRRGVRNARSALPALTGASQSVPESLIRYWLVAAGLPPPTPQCAVRDRTGTVIGHADWGWADARVAGEYEGRHHATPAQFQYDIERYAKMADAGWLVLRVAAVHLREPGRVVARFRTALGARGAIP